MHRGYTTPLVIAIMAFAVVAFLFLIDTAMNPDGSKKVVQSPNQNSSVVFCATNLKQCPDGTFVSRNGPNCEFAECPTTVNTNASATNPANNIFSFKTVRPGDRIGSMTVVESGKFFTEPEYADIEPNNKVVFSGKVTITGKISSTFSEFGGSNQVCVTDFTQDSLLLMPKAQEDDRPVYFCILGASAEKMLKDFPVGTSTTAEITIDDYTIAYYPSEVFNTATYISTSDPTAGWKTYTNTTYKYSIQYPDDYVLASTPNGPVSVVFQKGQPGQAGYQFVTISIINDSDTTLLNWAKKGFPAGDPAVTYHANPTKISYREDFIRTDGDLGSSGIPEYLVYHNNQLYSLTSFPASVDQTSNLALIKTFTFTD